MRLSTRRWVWLLAAILAGPALAETQPRLTGITAIHDPSVIVVDGRYASFATGVEGAPDGGMPRTKASPDGIAWSETGAIPGGLPGWIATELGYTPRNLWAPSVSEHGGVLYLYYSASRFGVNDSAIGLMTNAAFDPANPASGWQDQGLVIRSHRTDNYNAIDPFRFDTSDGKAWLAFGSFWDGIRMVELDPGTGMLAVGATPARIASRNGGPIEAASLLQHGGYTYLFVSFDLCCRGAGSTYRIMVGRAADPAGPYVGADGKPMLEGGGTELLASDGARRGPGGEEPFLVGGEPWLAWHYYNRDRNGEPNLQIAPLRWTADGWPTLDPAPED